MKRILSIIGAAAILVATGILFSASSLQVPTGTWIAVGPMNSARIGATTVLLQDGRILITGGNNSNGPSSTSEFFGANGSFSLAPAMNVPRSGHVAVVLQDGRVLVAGGTTSGGAVTNSAEIYDPVSSTWTNVIGGMVEARSGHTAAVLLDGRVLIAGGQNGSFISSTIEIFDPALGGFERAGMMSSPRTQHAMAVLTDGRVLIVGGNNGKAPVGSTDIFDPVAGTVNAGPSLSVPRFEHSATTLLNGQVVIIGGNNGNANPAQMDVTPAEIFDPTAATPAFTTLASNLATPREGHLAFLLPNNNNILIVGGTSGGVTVASAELFTSQESTQGVWTYVFGSTGSMAVARSSATGAPNQVSAPSSVMQRNGVLMVAGGKDANGNALNSAEAYGFPTVQSDQGDYPPGTTVNISGSGWKPGETVRLQIVESPLIDTHGPYAITADSNGNISDSSFATDIHDVDVKFTLTAFGSISQAQTTFTDKVATTTTVTCTTLSVQVDSPTTCTATVAPTNSANVHGTVSWTVTAGSGTFSSDGFNFAPGPPPTCTLTATGATAPALLCSVTYTPSSLGTQTLTATYVPDDAGKETSASSGSVTIQVTPGLVLQTPNPSSVPLGSSGPVTLEANLSASSTPIQGATVTFTVDGNSVGTAVTDSTGNATFSTYNPSALTLGNHTVQATSGALMIGGVPYTGATSNTQTLSVTQLGTTTAISAPAITYNANGVVTVTVSSTGGTPTGNVSLSVDGGTPVSKALASGSATFTNTDIAALTSPTAGNHNLSASYAAQNNFGASSNTGTLTVSQASVTITASSPSVTYGDPVPTITAGFSAFKGSDTSAILTTQPTCTTTYTTTSSTGTTPATSCSGAVATNYSFTYVPGSVTIGQVSVTITASSPSVTYGDPVPTITAGFSAFKGSDTSAILTTQPTCTTSYTTTSNAGTTPATSCSGAVAANYSFIYVPGGVTIGQASVTITASSPSVTYGDPVPTITAGFSAFKGSDTSAILTTQPTCTTTYTTTSSAGTKPATSCSGAVAANYSFAYVPGSVTISQATSSVTVTCPATPQTYTGSAQMPCTASYSTSDGLSGPLTVSYTSNINAGTAGASASYLGDGNHTGSSKTGSFTISQATASITVTPYSVTYDANPHTATGTATGVSGAILSAGLNLTGTTHTNARTYASDAWSFHDASGNYADASGTVSDLIKQATASITVTPYNVPFDNTAHTAGATANGVGGVDLSGDMDLSHTTHTNAGTYSADYWTFTDPTGNYNSVTATTIADKITPVNASITVTPYNVPFDNTAHTAGGTAKGVGGAILNADLDLSHTTHTNAGTYSADYWTFTDPIGNYNNVSATTITDQITAVNASITVTPYNVTFDGNAHAATGTATGPGGVSLIADFNLSGTTHTSTGTYASDAWSFHDASGNYVDASGTVSDLIIQAASTTTVTGGTFVYDGTSHAATVSVTGAGGLSLTATPTYSGSCTVAPITVAQGTSCMASYTYAGDANHTGSNGSAAVTITQRAITVQATSQTVYFGLQPAAFNYSMTYGTLIPGDLLGTPGYTFNGSPTIPTAIGVYTVAATGLWNPNYNVIYKTGTFTISPDVTSVTYWGSTSLTDLLCTTTVSANLSNVSLNGPISGATVTFALTHVNSTTVLESASGVTDSSGNVTVPFSLNVLTGSYTLTISYGGSSTQLPVTITQALTILPNPNVGPGPNAGTLYTGSRFFWTTSPTTSTATLALSATVQDMNPCASVVDITRATVSFAVSQDGTNFSPVNNAQNLPVGLVDPANRTLGTASATSQYDLGKNPSATIWVRVIVGGEYIYSANTFDVPVVIALPGQLNTMMAGGELNNDGSSIAGQYGFPASGYLGTAAMRVDEVDFAGTVNYSKSKSNPQGQLDVTMHTMNKSDGTVDTTEHTYWAKSNSISGLSLRNGSASFTAKYNLYETTGGAKTGLDSGALMQFTFTPNGGTYTVTTGTGPGGSQTFTCTAANGCASIVIFRSAGGVWFSSAWGTVGGLAQTVEKTISTGKTYIN